MENKTTNPPKKNGHIKGRDVRTISFTEIQRCAYGMSYNSACRILKCSSDMLRKFVRENYPELHAQFEKNGYINQTSANKRIT